VKKILKNIYFYFYLELIIIVREPFKHGNLNENCSIDQINK